MSAQFKITHDDSADSIYISFPVQDSKISHTDSFEIAEHISFGDINIDFNANKEIVGIEILSSKAILSDEVLNIIKVRGKEN